MKFIHPINKVNNRGIIFSQVIIKILSNSRNQIISFFLLYFFPLVLLLIKVSFQLLTLIPYLPYLFPEPLSSPYCSSSYSYQSFHNPNPLISQDRFLLNLRQTPLNFRHFLYLKTLLVQAQPTISSFQSSWASFFPYRKELWMLQTVISIYSSRYYPICSTSFQLFQRFSLSFWQSFQFQLDQRLLPERQEKVIWAFLADPQFLLFLPSIISQIRCNLFNMILYINMNTTNSEDFVSIKQFKSQIKQKAMSQSQ